MLKITSYSVSLILIAKNIEIADRWGREGIPESSSNITWHFNIYLISTNKIVCADHQKFKGNSEIIESSLHSSYTFALNVNNNSGHPDSTWIPLPINTE